MAIEHDLVEFVQYINKYYNDNKYILEPKDMIFKDYKVIVLADKDLGLSCNLCNSAGEYLAAFEITNKPNGYDLILRVTDYAVIWDGNLGYCTKLKSLDHTPAFEKFSSMYVKYCNDFDDSTLFQYRLIEEKADSIVLLVNELRDIISTKKCSTMYRVHLRG